MILLNQNNEDLLELLKASSVAYKKAKGWELFITIVLCFLAIAYPVYYLFIDSADNKNIQLALFVCSFALTILVMVFTNSIKGNTFKGAIYKEEFDTKLFGLPWKSTIKKPDYSEVTRLSTAYKGKKIKDWYSTKLSALIPEHIAIAVLQHSNTIWDIELRKLYRSYLSWIFYAHLAGLPIVLLYFEKDLKTAFFIYFSILSFYSHFITLIRGHTSAINKRKPISDYLDDIIQNKKPVSITELRDIQDEIYSSRQEAAKVPNFFSSWKHKQMNAIAEDYIQSVNKLYSK